MEYNIHLITGLSGGGAEHLVLDLSQRAKKDGKEVLIIVVTSINQIEHKFKNLDIECNFLNIDSFTEIKKGLKKAKHLISKFDKKSVIHCHMFHALMVALILKINGLGLNIVFTLHNNSVNSFLRRLILFFTKPLRCKDIVFSGLGEKWYLKNSIHLPNGINLSKFKTKNNSFLNNPLFFKFLFLGSLTDQKNTLYVPIIAKKILQKGYTNFKIYFIGDGPLKKELISKINSFGLENHIELLGFRNDVPEIIHEFQCQIMPSLWEGMPISILETGCVGLPVIAAPVGSIPDFLSEELGYLSSPENFHLAMIDLMENYSIALKKAELFRQKVRSEFDIDSIYLKHQNIYELCN